jgi:arylsulfatase
MDILPTLFALAGQPLPGDRSLDGRDIRAYINGDIWTTTPPAFSFIYTGASSNGIYGARKGAHKLHIRLYSQTGNNYGFSASRSNPLLFNVQTDPHERFDLSGSHPEIVAELNQLISGFEASLNEEGTFWGNP